MEAAAVDDTAAVVDPLADVVAVAVAAPFDVASLVVAWRNRRLGHMNQNNDVPRWSLLEWSWHPWTPMLRLLL